MGLFWHAKRFLLMVTCFIFFLDFQWPWRMPWNYRARDLLEDVACASPEGLAAESSTNSGVKVILPSVGQTGTTSVMAALHELGLRSYHIEENLVFARPTLLEDVNASSWARQMSRCRVEAVAMEPLTDVLHVALEASPDAKFILTWRDARTWVKSTRAGGSKDLHWHLLMSTIFASSARMLPWVSLWDAMTGQVTEMLRAGNPFHKGSETTALEMFGFYAFFKFFYTHPGANIFIRGTNKVGSVSTGDREVDETFLAALDEIRRTVPPERLLIFDVRKHGWPDLTKFLGLPDQPAGKPFPHPRSKNSWTNDTVWDYSSRDMKLVIVGILAALHIANYVIIMAGLRVVRSLWRSLRSTGRSKTE